MVLSISSDASSYRWAAAIQSSDLSIGDSYDDEFRHIKFKEMYSVAIAFESLALEGQHCRVDVHVDSQVTIHAWNGQGTRSR